MFVCYDILPTLGAFNHSLLTWLDASDFPKAGAKVLLFNEK